MPPDHPPDEDLLRQLPLPLAQLGRRARNAKTDLERSLAAYYLWEAALKLLAAVAVAEYAGRGPAAPDVAERLRALARPALGHWWSFARLLVPALADAGDEAFARQRDLLLGPPRSDLPRAAGLDAVLRELLEGKPGARATVQLAELFDRLVSLRNDDLGHGAAGQRPAAHYRRLAPALLAGATEIAARLGVLAGRRLVHVADVRRLGSGAWLVERYDLSTGEVRRLESLEVPEGQAASLPRPGRLYLQGPGADAGRPLHPLVVFDPEAEQVFFLNARVRQRKADYLCYATGEVVKRDELGQDRRDLLARVLGGPVDEGAVQAWAERSRADDPPSPAGGPRPRRTVGEFELVSRLGQGGMGVVYRAWQPSLGRQVALKCLMRSGDPKAEARFAREIKALGRVEHPNLVKVFTSGADGDQWFYAMELVEGADLAAVCARLSAGPATSVSEADWQAAVSTACERQRKKELPADAAPPGDGPAPTPAEPAAPAGRPGRAHVARAVEVVRQVAEAAHALHEAGVVHRDVKPGNVLLSADGGHAVLLDLGLAQLADETDGRLTRTRQFVGTLRYASPEQLLGAKLDRRADVYALGATLWELLTLRPLFGVTDQTPTPEAMLAIQTAEAGHARRHNPQVPADLDAVVMQCLEKDRARRYATARELADDLGRWLGGEPVLAQPPSLGYLLRKKARKYRARLATAAVALAALLLGAALLVVLAARQRGADELVSVAVREVEGRLAEAPARATAAEALRTCQDAEAAADRAVGLAGSALVSDGLRQRAAQARQTAREARAAAERDRVLLDRLLDVVTPRETARYARSESGVMAEVAEPAAEEQYAAAFRAWGLDMDATPTADAAARFVPRPPLVREAAAAGLDQWAVARRQAKHVDWRRLLELASAVDPADRRERQGLRAALAGDDPGQALGNLRGQARAAAGPVAEVTLLAAALAAAGDPAGAERLLRAATRTRPHEAALWVALGQHLESQPQPRWAEVVESYQAARAVNPALGVALARAQAKAGRAAEGAALLGELVRDRPDHPELHFYLGNALSDQGRPREAEAECREAIRLRPDYPEAHNNLGNALEKQGRPKEAEAEYREAIRLRPGFPEPHYNLGVALSDQGRRKEAEAECREAIRLRPGYPVAHFNLGLALGKQGRPKEAEAEYREAIRLKPGYPVAHYNLGNALRQQGHFTEALAELRRGHELGSRQPGWRYPSAQRVQECERLAALEARLPALLRGDDRPAPADLPDLTAVYQGKRLHAAAARLAAAALAANPILSLDLASGFRSDAARSAALAAAGQGADAGRLPAKERDSLRRQALDWLAADLAAWGKLAGNALARPTLLKTLRHWQEDPDLAGVREPAALAQLPEAERAQWQKLWADVAGLLRRADPGP
jgi:serine/threonine-protein kinase